mmetsp:Transcript_13044/g.19194  ORF Transcript_13044/g.19194 Transcript_13044/m.19194 type:complete len:384 (-) Transcript_13044:150-1301(-)|eukprot:CAMPEP_0194226800 /NCGR_PEP_ID=MMETSP0156-20130528/42525_1 /TAXON_ID=33649 /ORGANISM="Thalassionema nitzschioides, Strain L26-B" /LENGTH=383 /DNA_ID=CAMNT_0038959259 /DNA_START=109 /DNA_END=1260 /DNA_ORIENTATION=-
MGADPWITFGVSLVLLALAALGYHKTDRTFGLDLKIHVIYWAFVAGMIVLVSFVPVGNYVFSGLSYTFIGAWLPIYESIRAVCTPEEDDDKLWLQYWMVGGVLFMTTTFMDDVLGDAADVYWHLSLFFLFFWLYFPKTDGAHLIYEKVTKPFVAPLIKPVVGKMDNLIKDLYQMVMNAAHLWIIWIFFMFLPSGLKRIVSIAVGTVYPFVSSVKAATTDEVEDDTYWLTYWSCYGILFILMDIIENWIGWIPGFYSLVIFSTVYLMLPMFGGADKIFRKILVPLAGLQELLMMRDAIAIKKSMLKDLDPERARSVRKAIAKFYESDDDSNDTSAMKNELMSGYKGLNLPAKASSIKMPSFRMPSFKPSNDSEGIATENTSLVV